MEYLGLETEKTATMGKNRYDVTDSTCAPCILPHEPIIFTINICPTGSAPDLCDVLVSLHFVVVALHIDSALV